MASSAAGISGVLGYVLLLAAGCFAPPPAAKWWKHPVSGCVTKDHIVLQFEHLHIKAPIGFFNYEITDKAILVKQKKSRLTCLLLLPRRWLRPQDSAIVASRLKNTAEVQPTEDVEPILPANATPIYRPRSKSERSTRLFIAILGLSLWWILLTALGIANVVCNGYTFFYLLIVIGLTVNLAARYRNRNGAWKSNESPTGSCDLIGWLTDEQLIAFVQQTKVTVDISRIYYDTGTGGLEITGVPLRGSMALYPDLCPPGTFEQARKNLRTKTALVWNVYRHWKNRNSSTGNTPLR